MILTQIKAMMFNSRAKEGSQQVLESLHIKKGDHIADIGSGGGYFVFHFLKLTGPKGVVYAADIDTKLLAQIEKKRKRLRIENLKMIICSEKGCRMPEAECDIVFMRNVFHHIKEPVSYFINLKDMIKPEGKIAIIEWRQKAMLYAAHRGHSTDELVIKEALEEAGYGMIQSFHFLEQQSFQIFEKLPETTIDSSLHNSVK